MRVGVQGHSYGGVPEELLDKLLVDPSAKKQRGAGVPQVVEADLGQAFSRRGLKERLTRFSAFIGVPTPEAKIRPSSL